MEKLKANPHPGLAYVRLKTPIIKNIAAALVKKKDHSPQVTFFYRYMLDQVETFKTKQSTKK